MPRVAVNIVTFNSAPTIQACLGAIFAQDFDDFSVTVIDNGSQDDTVELVAPWQSRGLRLLVNRENRYFSRAHNQAIEASDSEFVLAVNPDVVMYPDYLSQIVRGFSLSPKIGSVNGKLLLLDQSQIQHLSLARAPEPHAPIDGAGLMIYRSRRPYLRGHRQLHGTTCLRPEHIFGVDAACGAYRRSMLEDVCVFGEYFDNDFVIYREDVDLAWRAQLFGWESFYMPTAIGYHARGFQLGRGRRSIQRVLKRHSVRNGWLLLVKNDSLQSLTHSLPYFLPYQGKITAGLLTIETSSILAIPEAMNLLPRMMRKRAYIQSRRQRSDAYMRLWFE